MTNGAARPEGPVEPAETAGAELVAPETDPATDADAKVAGAATDAEAAEAEAAEAEAAEAEAAEAEAAEAEAAEATVPLQRQVSGYGRRSEELEWSVQVTEAAARELAAHLDHGPDTDLVDSYELVGDALAAAARLAGFEIRADLEYFLESSAP